MKNRVISIIFLITIIGLGFISVLTKDNLLSTFERRKLAQFPKLNKDFIENLEEYLLDQFVFRNQLINLNSFINRKILNKIDNNEVYVIDNNMYDKTYPLDEKQVTNFSKKVNYIIGNYCNDSNVYYSIIPDKSKFLSEEKYLKIDYNKLYNLVTSNTKGTYIDIDKNLNIEDYYKTDIHWKQENLSGVVKKLVNSMGKEYKEVNYRKFKYDNFFGALYSKAGTNLEPDVLTYLYNKDMENIHVTHLEYGKKIYMT